MHLKSLKLQGYKTFAGSTHFELADHITCIVGPNGSGKSNIADAIRWVLGEQAYSLLRGKKTIDMIFHGSEQRSRAGMAAVEIIFDNTNGWLPVDFSEVSIGRRAYRDGTNEYLLNGQKVRLRDISELLGNSGLSERTYTVIGQGLVDSALSLRADERRRLFEEAAGIGLYRSRREEAQRRLETTRRNLERVEDILAELKPRLRSLERQSRRVEQYELVKADLQVLLRDWYGFHWHRAQRDINSARQTAKAQESTLGQAQQKQANLDQKLTSFRAHIQGVRARLSSWHRELSQLHAQREKITRKLAVSDERARSLIKQRQDMSDELTRLEQKIELHRERLTEADAETQRLEAELQQARGRANSARDALKARQVERQQVENKIQQTQQQIAELSNRQTRLQARLDEREAQVQRQRADLDAIEKAVAEADQALEKVKARLQHADQTLETAISARQKAETSLHKHRQDIVEVESQRKAKAGQRDSLQANLARLQAQLEVLEQAEKALAGYASGTRLLLKSAQKGKLEGAQGALSGQLRVPKELEPAIAAALGEYLDAVLLADEGSVEAALEILMKQSSRGTLLPLDALVPPEPLKNTAGKGVLGIASDLIQAAPELRPAVDLFLGQTLVVQDRAAARRTLLDQPRTARAVTLRGEVFFATGPVAAGQGGGAATLSRPRQRREIVARVKETQRKIEAAKQVIDEFDGMLAQLQADEAEFQQNVSQLQRREAATAQVQRDVSLEHEREQRQVQWQHKRCQSLRGEIKAGETESSRIKDDLSTLDEEISQARENLRKQQSSLGNLSLEKYQLDLHHWGTQAAVAEQALNGAQARRRERGSTLSDAKNSQEGLRSRLGSLATEVEMLETEKLAVNDGEANIVAEIDALRVLVEPAESELDGSEEKQDVLRKAEAEARKALSMADRRCSQAQLNLTRSQEGLDRLRERIEADVGLVSFDYGVDVSGPTPLPFDGLVKRLPILDELPDGMDKIIKEKRGQLRRIGAVNPEAQKEHDEVRERHEFMISQVDDLHKADADIREVIAELDLLMEREFRLTFDAVAKEFRQIFTRLFGGGGARLILTQPDDLTETGIDIDARLPGQRTQSLSLLSGGERSLTATALIFSLLKVSPTPFCVLDEVDAMLDESNVARFRDLLRELSENTQFIVITHNRNTVQAADVIYGITMGSDSASQIISLRLDQVADVIR
ncbi:MAG: chromosome segregation protein SMC [Chloroflexota bacterium]|nr:chromosome segregation protein SMC [Chloroflexota bacterium]